MEHKLLTAVRVVVALTFHFLCLVNSMTSQRNIYYEGEVIKSEEYIKTLQYNIFILLPIFYIAVPLFLKNCKNKFMAMDK